MKLANVSMAINGGNREEKRPVMAKISVLWRMSASAYYASIAISKPKRKAINLKKMKMKMKSQKAY
jgi:hypothetical protein